MWCHVVLALIVANAICHISHARVERKMRDDDLIDRFVRKSYRYATIEAAQFTMAAIPLETRRRIKAELLAGAKAESNGAGSGRIPRVVRANEVPPEKIEWLWPGRLALGKISLLEGDPGLGKSTLTLEIAARLSTGRPLPGGRILPPTGSLFLSAEDGVADTIVPRLMA